MTKLLQDKDDQWRKRPNGATPVFDPGLSTLGTDDEAGGARAPSASTSENPEMEPMPAAPIAQPDAPRLKPWFWALVAGLVLVALALAAVVSVA